MGLKELWKNVLEGDEEVEVEETTPSTPKEKIVETEEKMRNLK